MLFFSLLALNFFLIVDFKQFNYSGSWCGFICATNLSSLKYLGFYFFLWCVFFFFSVLIKFFSQSLTSSSTYIGSFIVS